jgi:hypothetical protein
MCRICIPTLVLANQSIASVEAEAIIRQEGRVHKYLYGDQNPTLLSFINGETLILNNNVVWGLRGKPISCEVNV